MNYQVPKEIIDLIKITLPDKSKLLEKDGSLETIVTIAQAWHVGGANQRIEASLQDKYTPYKQEIFDTLSVLGLKNSLKPKHKNHQAVIILGSTGLSHYQIWKDLIQLYEKENLKFNSIFLLGGDRVIHPVYDRMDTAYKYHPEDFNRFLNVQEILACKNEMVLMELITSTLKLPEAFKKYPIHAVYSKGKTGPDGAHIQADTRDTLIELSKSYTFVKEEPLLFMSTLPYIVRQGLWAEECMPGYKIDIAGFEHPYLETIDTPLKGELPTALYLDEIYWFLKAILDKKGYFSKIA